MQLQMVDDSDKIGRRGMKYRPKGSDVVYMDGPEGVRWISDRKKLKNEM